MVPHLVRARSAYKDIRIHSCHYTHTHAHTHTHTDAHTLKHTCTLPPHSPPHPHTHTYRLMHAHIEMHTQRHTHTTHTHTHQQSTHHLKIAERRYQCTEWSTPELRPWQCLPAPQPCEGEYAPANTVVIVIHRFYVYRYSLLSSRLTVACDSELVTVSFHSAYF